MKQTATISLGTSTVPCGQRGDWALEEFTISEREAAFSNLSCLHAGRSLFRVRPGRYKRLVHRSRGVVMSNTPMEVTTNYEALNQAKGHVLINGLGMGMLLEAVLSKPEVENVRVIEVDPDVIALVGPHFSHDPRVTIVQADALVYKPEKGARFDFVWHDIWDDICADNLPQMKALVRKYRKPIAQAQGVWSRSWIEAMERR